MTKVHVIADESLGGVKREYIEVDRPAKVGDKVTYVFSGNRDGIIVTAMVVRPDGEVADIHPYYKSDGDLICGFGANAYRVLEPTDIVHVDGERFRMVDRKAKVGEKIIVVDWDDDSHVYNDVSIGETLTVNYLAPAGSIWDVMDREIAAIITKNEYRVLEPLASNDIVTAEEGDDKSVIELLANLARRVTELERQMEANTKDIAYLDERTRSTNDDPTFTLTQIIEALGGACR